MLLRRWGWRNLRYDVPHGFLTSSSNINKAMGWVGHAESMEEIKKLHTELDIQLSPSYWFALEGPPPIVTFGMVCRILSERTVSSTARHKPKQHSLLRQIPVHIAKRDPFKDYTIWLLNVLRLGKAIMKL
jgi:hypothetical protein